MCFWWSTFPTFDLQNAQVLEKVSARQMFSLLMLVVIYVTSYTTRHCMQSVLQCSLCRARPGRPLDSTSAGKCSKEHHRGVTRYSCTQLILFHNHITPQIRDSTSKYIYMENTIMTCGDMLQ